MEVAWQIENIFSNHWRHPKRTAFFSVLFSENPFFRSPGNTIEQVKKTILGRVKKFSIFSIVPNLQWRVSSRRACSWHVGTISTVVTSRTSGSVRHGFLWAVKSRFALEALWLFRQGVVCAQRTFRLLYWAILCIVTYNFMIGVISAMFRVLNNGFLRIATEPNNIEITETEVVTLLSILYKPCSA